MGRRLPCKADFSFAQRHTENRQKRVASLRMKGRRSFFAVFGKKGVCLPAAKAPFCGERLQMEGRNFSLVRGDRRV